MCGIAGKLNFDGERPVAPALLRTMLDAIRHRGPDDQGILVAPGFGLGHCRLAIIDLISGRQPLCNEDGSVWLAFNGEIYNYRELHRALSRHGHVFRTQSDSETIVHLYEELGEECVQKLRGMFAFALWDARRQRLFLARDRVGIKPLYYFLSERSIIFASEMKAILMDPEVPREVLPEAVGRFLTFGYLPGEETALRNIRKLPPACCLSISKGQLRTWRYWDLRFHPVWRPPDQAESELLALLQESVRLHLVSDAPLGFLLSGGLDSTSLLALAASDARSLRTFTIGFSGRGISDERFYARLAARAYGSEHHDTTITARDFQDFLPRYVWHMEEPVCEPPAVALYYISLLAAKSVKVLVSGEGGDEVFAGYTNYKNILWLERLKSAFPRLSRGLALTALLANHAFPSQAVARCAPRLSMSLDGFYYGHSATPFQPFNCCPEIYSADFVSVMSGTDRLRPLQDCLRTAPSDVLSRMLYIDGRTWLPDDLLLKADKMTMANSVELRVPFLDHHLLEFAASLPSDDKIKHLTTKYALRQALCPLLPAPIRKRKKAGFPVPYAAWLRFDLRDWIDGIVLDPSSLARGYFRPDPLEHLLAKNARSGKFSREVFSLAVLELWHRQFLPALPRRAGEQAPADEIWTVAA